MKYLIVYYFQLSDFLKHPQYCIFPPPPLTTSVPFSFLLVTTCLLLLELTHFLYSDHHNVSPFHLHFRSFFISLFLDTVTPHLVFITVLLQLRPAPPASLILVNHRLLSIVPTPLLSPDDPRADPWYITRRPRMIWRPLSTAYSGSRPVRYSRQPSVLSITKMKWVKW